MNEYQITNESRRQFLKTGAGVATGLTLAVHLPLAFAGDTGLPAGHVASELPGTFVRIGTDSIVTVVSKHTEMGQGAYTGL